MPHEGRGFVVNGRAFDTSDEAISAFRKQQGEHGCQKESPVQRAFGAVARDLHDSIDSLSFDDERRQRRPVHRPPLPFLLPAAAGPVPARRALSHFAPSLNSDFPDVWRRIAFRRRQNELCA